MSQQISDNFSGMNLDWGELKLSVQSLCGGALVTGSTGSGKTVSVVNPLAAKLASLNSNKAGIKPAIIYFVTKGASHESFIEGLPAGRKKDVIRIDGRQDCGFSLSLFPTRNWSSRDELELAVPAFLEEFSEHCWDALSTVRHDLFWDRQRMRVLSELSALRSIESDIFTSVSGDHLKTLLDRLDAFIAHIETPSAEPDAQILKKWFEKVGVTTPKEFEHAKEVAETAMLTATKDSTMGRLLQMMSRMSAECASPSKIYGAPDLPLERIYQQLDAPSKDRLSRLVREYFLLAQTTRSCVLADLQSLVHLLRSGPAGNVFNQNNCTTVSLEKIIHDGKILVLDLPLSDSSNATRPVLLAIKLALMNRILGRNRALCEGQKLNRTRPIVIVIDEFQTLISRGRSGGEDQFISRCREFGAISILATQSLSLLAGTIRDSAKLEALLANLRTRVFGHNTDTWTNEQAAALCGTSAGRDVQLAQIWHGSERLKKLVTVTASVGNPRVSPGTFAALKTGQFIVSTADGACHTLDASGNNFMNPQVCIIP
jgi:hypothetical protein